MWTNRSRIIFVSCLLIAGAILLQMGMYALHVFFDRELTFNLLQLCNNWLKSLGFLPIGYFLGGLVIYTFAMCIWLLSKQLYMSHLMYRKLMKAHQETCSEEISRFGITGDNHIHIFSCPEPMAFTMGFLKPKVFLATGLLNLLDKQEIKAVIYHELQHKKSADPLKMFILSLCASVFWYIPLLKWMLHQYKIAREIVADQYAIDQMGSPVQLGSALLKLLKKGSGFSMPFTYASFADTSVNYRIKQILDPHTKISFKPPVRSTLVSLHILLAISVLYIFNLY
ncbi:M56 family metallopeptidase [Paenibacillus agricola]|uniref:M56 family metallopeptidase n=1 Tax=Paenibacillus agricola TaxID=2716264 RepID=A0ABX0J7P8_9BACL|nr:M56 family metallopeptidase [Paenibacillus agricola]NHN32452.1 M56 family metallopeptidase [Paenibacillus agricola]